jgi:hypothetical protein
MTGGAVTARLRGGAGLALALAVTFAAAPARAETRRYALVIGSNAGATHEPPLRFAEADARAVGEALTGFGGFPSERIVRVLGASATRVRAALVDLNLAMQQDLRGGGEGVLFVYYSGHADAQNLHLGGSELSTDELSKLVRLSPAKLKVLLVDACRSGALTRVKGGRPVESFQIGVEDQLRNEGYAIITSSAAGEDAQESDAIGSSIFTHHFLAGLRGVADANGDRLVTLGEVYTYAAEQTVKSSIATIAGAQHATFDFDLRGRTDPVLADLRARGEHAELTLATPGEYLVLAADTGALVVEANVKTGRTPLLLAPGRYALQLRTRTNMYETQVALIAGQAQVAGQESMRPVPLAQVVRKGATATTFASGPQVAGMVHGALASGFSPMMGAQLGWVFELPHVSLIPRLSLGFGHALAPPPDVASHTFREVSVELAGAYVIDVGRLALAPLVSVGWGFFTQALDRGPACMGDACDVTAHPQGLITTLGGWAAWPLGWGFSVEASLELASFYLRRQGDTAKLEEDAPRAGTLTYRAGVGIGYRY